jgi:hypothetical protein
MRRIKGSCTVSSTRTTLSTSTTRSSTSISSTTRVACPTALQSLHDCEYSTCSGTIRPSPEPTPGAFCRNGCPCIPTSGTPVDCPQGIPCWEANVGCDPILVDGNGICQGAYKYCSCSGYCPNLNYCNDDNCDGVPNPTSPGWGTCASGTASGCLCTTTVAPPPISTSTSTSAAPTQTDAIYIVLNIVEVSPDEKAAYSYVIFDGVFDSDATSLNIDPCTATPAYTAQDPDGSYDSNNQPPLPTVGIGPFTTHNIPNCDYDPAIDGSVGSLLCSNAPPSANSQCVLSPAFGTVQNCTALGQPGQADDMIPVLACYWW